jgi:hypothetical protein
MQSSLLSPTSVKRAVARMRTANATGVASATLCTYAFHRKSWQAHCGTLSAWNDDSTPQRMLAAKVAGSRATVAQMAGARVLQHGRSVGKVVERVVIANGKGREIAAKWLVERIPALTSEFLAHLAASSYLYVSISVMLGVLGMKVAINQTLGFTGLNPFEGVTDEHLVDDY